MNDPAPVASGLFAGSAPFSLVWADDPAKCYKNNKGFLPSLPVTDAVEESYSFATATPSFKNAFSRSGQSFQLDALLDFFFATNMDSARSRPNHNWFDDLNGAAKYCNFTGVQCDTDGNVIILDLDEQGLSGTLPESIGELTGLHRLRLFNNNMFGTIPTSLYNLVELRQINLEFNEFSGIVIPEEVGNLQRLKRYLVQGNDFEGTIPESVCSLYQLRALDLSDNPSIHGTIPACLGDSALLSVLNLRNLDLTGIVPPGLCTERPLNNLPLNELGCDGIACGEGFYLPGTGRQENSRTPCRPCTGPSNVIGSTSCRVVVEHQRISTLSPTNEPTQMPMRLVSTKPSDMPSSTVSNHPSGSAMQNIFVRQPLLVPVEEIHPPSTVPSKSPLTERPSLKISSSYLPSTVVVSSEPTTPMAFVPQVDIDYSGFFPDIIPPNSLSNEDLPSSPPSLPRLFVGSTVESGSDMDRSEKASSGSITIMVVGLVAFFASFAAVVKVMYERYRMRKFRAGYLSDVRSDLSSRPKMHLESEKIDPAAVAMTDQDADTFDLIKTPSWWSEMNDTVPSGTGSKRLGINPYSPATDARILEDEVSIRPCYTVS